MEQYPQQLVALASFRKFIGHIQSAWPGFLNQRRSRLVQAERNGSVTPANSLWFRAESGYFMGMNAIPPIEVDP